MKNPINTYLLPIFIVMLVFSIPFLTADVINRPGKYFSFLKTDNSAIYDDGSYISLDYLDVCFENDEYNLLSEDEVVLYDKLNTSLKHVLNKDANVISCSAIIKASDSNELKDKIYNALSAFFTDKCFILESLKVDDYKTLYRSSPVLDYHNVTIILTRFEHDEVNPYFDSEDYENIDNMNRQINEICSQVTDIEAKDTITYFYNFARNKCTYNYEALEDGSDYIYLLNTSVFNFLKEEVDKSVCEGFANTVSLLCRKANIECYYKSGMSGEIGHAWNEVPLDGTNYLVDATKGILLEEIDPDASTVTIGGKTYQRKAGYWE